MPTTQVEDLLVTFVHRPLKAEPIDSAGHIFHNSAQLDGQVDVFSEKSSTSTVRWHEERHLSKTIAKVNANRSDPPRSTKLLHGPLPPNDRSSLTHNVKKPRTDQTPKQSRSIPIHRDGNREKTIQSPKPKTKPKPTLLPSVLKKNQTTIRPLLSNVSSRPDTAKVSRDGCHMISFSVSWPRRVLQPFLVSTQKLRSSRMSSTRRSSLCTWVASLRR